MSSIFDHLLRRWDDQQEFYHKYRNERYEAMFDLLEASGKSEFTILDLASGPGSLSLRFLRRFPDSKVVMVDQDPVLLRISREAFRGISGNYTWKVADIADENWSDGLEPDSFDAVMSTTALHWLDEDGFYKACTNSFKLLHKGGYFMNGDNIHSSEDRERFLEAESQVRELYASSIHPDSRFDWDSFWKLVRKTPELEKEVSDRDRIYPPGSSHDHSVSLERQSQLLVSAGFTVIGTVWSRFSNRILSAVK